MPSPKPGARPCRCRTREVPGDDASSLLRRADDAMYAVKRSREAAGTLPASTAG